MINNHRSPKPNSTPESMPGHPLENLTPEERLARINQMLGAWKDQPDLLEIFAEIDRDRHAYRGRQIDSMDD